MKINQSFHVLMNKFENPPDYGNFVPIMLNVMTKISLIVVLLETLGEKAGRPDR